MNAVKALDMVASLASQILDQLLAVPPVGWNWERRAAIIERLRQERVTLRPIGRDENVGEFEL